MPNFLKSIFKPLLPSHHSHSNSKSREIEHYPYQDERRRSSTDQPPTHHRIRRDTLEELLRTEFRSRNPSLRSIDESSRERGYGKDAIESLIDTVKSENDDSNKSGKSEKDQKRLKKLLKVLEDVELEGSNDKDKDKGKGKEKVQISTENDDPALQESKLLKPVIRICSKAIDTGEILLKSYVGQGPNEPLLSRVIALLEAQKDELGDIELYTGRRRYPALVTLEHIYEKVRDGLKEIRGMSENNARDSLFGLIQVLQEGPDYLIDIILITSIIYQSSMISIPFSNEIRSILDNAIDHQQQGGGTSLSGFKKAAESIIALSSAINRSWLEDKESEVAYKRIGVLIKHLQARVSSSALPTTISSLPASRNVSFSIPSTSGTPTPLTLPGTPNFSPSVSPIQSISSSLSSSPSTPTPRFNSMTTTELQKQFGTGQSTPLPGLSSYNSTPTPSGTNTPIPSSRRDTKANIEEEEEEEDAEEEEEIWEYRGQLLTASALDLVLREEMLLQADSSNQYSGEVSYDDLRKRWIPKHVQKLKISDLTEEEDGEIVDTTPAGFKLKEEDEWGNKIGWYDNGTGIKEMYYIENPKFELPEDD